MSGEELILELGSGEQGGYPHSPTKGTIRIDVQSRFRVDVVADAQVLPFRDASFGGVIAISIMEHVPRPWRLVAEVRRVLQPKGLVVGYVPYMFPYHADETFSDYYRFSDEALRFLFRDYSSIEIHSAGGYTNTLFRFIAGFTATQRHILRFEKGAAEVLSGLARASGISNSTRVRGLKRSTTGHVFVARK